MKHIGVNIMERKWKKGNEMLHDANEKSNWYKTQGYETYTYGMEQPGSV